MILVNQVAGTTCWGQPGNGGGSEAMSDFAGMEDLLQDLVRGQRSTVRRRQAGRSERMPDDRGLLNDIFRGFHTIGRRRGISTPPNWSPSAIGRKTSSTACATPNFTRTPDMMDVIMAATATGVRDVRRACPRAFSPSQRRDGGSCPHRPNLKGAGPARPVCALHLQRPPPKPPLLPGWRRSPAQPSIWVALHACSAAVTGFCPGAAATMTPGGCPEPRRRRAGRSAEQTSIGFGRRATDKPGGDTVGIGRVEKERAREHHPRRYRPPRTRVLNLSGEIGLTKNRPLPAWWAGLSWPERAIPKPCMFSTRRSASRDLLVSIRQELGDETAKLHGRLFQKIPRTSGIRPPACGKDVELVLAGEETGEVDKTMIEDSRDPLHPPHLA